MDETGLDLSADIEDAEVIIKSLSTNISKNLY
jgi:hypothetical protein